MSPEEINEKVALGLGWKKDQKNWWYRPAPSGAGYNMSIVGLCPDYSRDIGAVWEVVENLASKGFAVKVVWMMQLGTCVINYNGGEPLAHANADTAPMAICLAFLELKASCSPAT